MIDKKVKQLIENCKLSTNQFRKERNKDIYLCQLPVDYKRLCFYQRNKVNVPEYVNGKILIREYYICRK